VAGSVKIQAIRGQGWALSFEPCPCPAQAEVWPRPKCVRRAIDGSVSTCPFLYATLGRSAGRWLRHRSIPTFFTDYAEHGMDEHSLRVLCLRADSKTVNVGAD